MTLAEIYLHETGGDVEKYRRGLVEQRIGQSFFNALCYEDQYFIRGTHADPFYTNDSSSVVRAIEFLLDTSRKVEHESTLPV